MVELLVLWEEGGKKTEMLPSVKTTCASLTTIQITSNADASLFVLLYLPVSPLPTKHQFLPKQGEVQTH